MNNALSEGGDNTSAGKENDNSQYQTVIQTARNLLHALDHYHSDDLAGEVIEWADALKSLIGMEEIPYE